MANARLIGYHAAPFGVSPSPNMAMLYEFLPLALFLIALIMKDIYFAVIVLMVGMTIGVVLKYVRTKKLDRMYFWSTVLALFFGAATLYFRDPKFLFWKPTVFYWALALACIASHWIGDKPIVQRFFGLVAELNTEKLTAGQWARLNMAWTAFFASVGVLNLYVAFNFSIEFWGTFKALGLFGLSLIFIVSQSIWIVSKLGDDALVASNEDQS